MIGGSKNNRENDPRKCFSTQEKETRVKFNPGLSANRPSNNWALEASDLTALPMRSETEELRLLLIGKYSFHTEISNRTFRGPNGLLLDSSLISLPLDLCGLQRTALVAQEGERLAEFAANEGKSSYVVGWSGHHRMEAQTES